MGLVYVIRPRRYDTRPVVAGAPSYVAFVWVSLCVSVSVLDRLVSAAKTAKPIESKCRWDVKTIRPKES